MNLDARRGAPVVAALVRSACARAAVIVCAMAVPGLAGCLERRDTGFVNVGKCTRCHGTESRAGSDLLKAAPPSDLSGQVDIGVPTVGAHQVHLTASATHQAVSCDACHVVPTAADSPGHAESIGPAIVTFSALAAQGGRSPSYDRTQGTCADTYCHRSAAPAWTAPRDANAACGTCHGLPPGSPHVVRTDCSTCHGLVVDTELRIIGPERHVNGKVDVAVLPCNTCHGSDNQGSPPPDLDGNTSSKSPGNGAHQIHLTGGPFFRPVECSACHVVPGEVLAPGHLDTPRPAEVAFSGIAAANGAVGAYDGTTCSNVYCHGAFSRPSGASQPNPVWTVTDGTYTACGACHGLPPPAPHPRSAVNGCRDCHANVDADGAIVKRELHGNGQVE